jgi:hypothetical protein
LNLLVCGGGEFEVGAELIATSNLAATLSRTNVMFRCIREWKNGPTLQRTYRNFIIAGPIIVTRKSASLSQAKRVVNLLCR